MEVEKDYLAICFIMAGSCFGRAPTKAKAIEICRQEAQGFARAFGGFKADFVDLKINVYDATGHDKITWNATGAVGDAGDLADPEVISINPHKKYKPAA